MDCCLFGNNPLSEPVMLATIHYLNQWCWQQSIIWTSDVGNNPLSEPVMLATIHYLNQWCWQQSIIWTSDVGNNPLSEPVMLATIHYLNQWCWQQSIIWTSDEPMMLCCFYNSPAPSAAYMSGNQVSIASDNGLSPIQHKAIMQTNAGLLLIEPLGMNFSEILIKIQNFSFTKMHPKTLPAKCQPFCLGVGGGWGRYGMGRDELTLGNILSEFYIKIQT